MKNFHILIANNELSVNDMFFDFEWGQKLGLWVLAIDSGLLLGPTCMIIGSPICNAICALICVFSWWLFGRS